MQAVLNINLNEVDNNLLKIIRELLSKNAEILIRKESVVLEEYNKSLSLSRVMKEFSEAGYSEAFLTDLKKGFETSSVYDENKIAEE